MLKSILFCLMLVAGICSLPHQSFAQKDKLEGIWYNEEKTAKIEIYKAVDGKFWGKIVWLQEAERYGKPRVDEFNPNPKLRNVLLMGYPVLKHFKIKNEDTYNDGEIYDSKIGKTYSCTITFRNKNELGIRGYIGISLIGRTTTFTRVDPIK